MIRIVREELCLIVRFQPVERYDLYYQLIVSFLLQVQTAHDTHLALSFPPAPDIQHQPHTSRKSQHRARDSQSDPQLLRRADGMLLEG